MGYNGGQKARSPTGIRYNAMDWSAMMASKVTELLREYANILETLKEKGVVQIQV